MTSFRSGGLELSFDDVRPAGGEVGTVVLVHGFATNRSENWRRLGWYGAFERKGYRVVALDLRGHGASAKPHDPLAYARIDMAGDIVALMDFLQLGRVELMGYSLGAHLAAQAALVDQARIGHLILGGVGARMLAAQPLAAGAMTLAQAMRIADPALITEPTLKGFRLFADQQGEDRLALAAASEGAHANLSGQALSALALPVLVVAGARDEIAGDPQTLADTIPGAKAVTLPGCDHFSAIPHALFKAAVFDFLEDWPDEI
jgi:pimeloyl-ACP methyl ester carboxylesterase